MKRDEKFEDALTKARAAMDKAKETNPRVKIDRLILAGVFAFLKALGVVGKDKKIPQRKES